MNTETVGLVTGAGSGIGRAVALAFGEAGVRTVVADVADAAGEETAELIGKAGGTAIFVHTDVTSTVDVEKMVATAVRVFGRLDYAVNNAGIASSDKRGPVAEFPEEEWDRIVAVNLKGVFLCLKYECRQMIRHNSGAIVNTASTMGVLSRPGLSAYCASKAGVIGLTQTVALDYAAQGIRVNAICPGGVHTPMTSDPLMQKRLSDVSPMRRLGEPAEIADAVLWLCSDRASFITGQAIGVDGGYLATGA